jgi:acetoacetyl-CoA synthetase
MWNWQVSGLASGATLILYDGSPFAYKGKILLDLAQQERVTFFGTSAKYIDALSKTSIQPIKTHEFPHLKTIASTGSPLSPESFDYIYTSFKSDVQLASISGGTDLVGCFVLGNPLDPIYKGQIQCAGLGMMLDVFDDQGNSITSEKGELVCKNPFMSQPIYFWNDINDQKRMETYFSKYPNVWHHGDYIERTQNGGFIIHGRSDTTLNPGGVRIGTAEIYRQVEKIEEVLESLVIGQDYEHDIRIILFVKLKDGFELCDDLINKIKHEIRENTTPRHMPAKIIAVPDIPKTKSGKITEIAVRDLIHGKKINNTEAIANPEVLVFFENLVIE